MICTHCHEVSDLVFCRVENQDLCLECGQRAYLAWLQKQPFALHPSAFWSPEKQERQLARIYKVETV
jgi:hypothetical protein